MSSLKICAVSLLCVLLVACGESDTVSSDNDRNNHEMERLANAFYVERDEYMGSIKRTVEIKLAYKFSLEQLRAVAENIKAAGARRTERIFIGYTLDKHSPGYWATTHYNPELKVCILEDAVSCG